MPFSDVNNIKHSHILAIQDTVDSPGKFLIKEFIATLFNSEVHIFCYDCFHQDLFDELNTDQSVSVHYHDCLPRLSENEGCEDELVKFSSSIKSLKCSSRKLVLIIDSLSTVLLEKSLHPLSRLLRQMTLISTCAGGRIQVQVVVMLHEDTLLNPVSTVKHLKSVCRAWMHVKYNTVTLSIRKTSGKLLIQSYEFEFHFDGNLIIRRKKHVAKDTRDDFNENTPISTFKLTLSESEKKARDAVKLPYESREDEKSTTTGGEIFYVPDDFDDWDEEDPDNDLEFS